MSPATLLGGQGRASVGVAFTPFEDRIDVIERTAVLAEQRGFDSVGIAEAMTLDAPIVLSRLAGLTDRIGVGQRRVVGVGSHAGHPRAHRQ